MRKSVVLTVAALAFAGCVGPSQPGTSGGITPTVQVQPGRQFDLALGQSAQVQGSSVAVRFGSVAEDSRCPSDVQCVWAGNAALRLTFASFNASSIEATVNTTLDPKSVSYGGFLFRLVGLRPVPKSGSRIPDADYVATFEITN